MVYSHLFLQHNVHHTLRDDDNLCYLEALKVLLSALVVEHSLLDGLVVGIGGELHFQTGLAVEGHTQLDGILDQVLLIPLRPLGIADATLAAQHLKELFSNVGSKRSDEYHERLHHLTVLALLLRQFVDADHKGRDGGVVRERLDVLRHLLDEFVDGLQVLRSSVCCCVTATYRTTEVPELLQEAVATVDTVGVPGFRLLHGTEEHLVETQGVGTVLLDNHIRIDDVEHRLRHLFDGPAALVLTILKNEFGIAILRTPSLEGLNVEHVSRDDVHIDVDRRRGVLVLQAEADELTLVGTLVLDAIHEVGAALNHTLIDQLLERLVLARVAGVIEELVPETAINQVTRSMLRTTHVEVDVAPVLIDVLVDERLLILRVHIAQVVSKDEIDNKTVFPLELNTMPGFAGSSAYYLRYMDPKNEKALVSREADEYWRNVDLYVGGTEHATGHLIYSRFWNKFLYDSGYSCEDEPFKKLVNQGMIQGRSNFVYRIEDEGADKGKFVSFGLKDNYTTTPIHVDVNIVSADVLDIEAFKAWRPEYEKAEFILENGQYKCGWAIEKMSKSMFNVVNPDMIVEKYGADTLRLYEMFLGPVEQSKPWDTNGIDGCHRFLRKFWNLYQNGFEGDATPENLKSVHKLIKKVSQDIETFSYNTSISAFMICVNELSQQKCKNKELLKTLVILIAPFAPHIAEELWEMLGEHGSVCDAQWPTWNEEYLVESQVKLGIAFNGKARFEMSFAADADNKTIEEAVLSDERAQKYIEGKQIMKVIIVPKRMVNIVCK